jgi:hypothetical protein
MCKWLQAMMRHHHAYSRVCKPIFQID